MPPFEIVTTFRDRHKRVVGTTVEPSHIWQHGADLSHKGKRYFLCMHCHLKQDYSHQIFSAGATTSAAMHLEKAHHITKAGSSIPPSLHANPWQLTSAINPYAPQQFDGSQFKRNYLEWVLADDVTFRQASSTRLAKLIDPAANCVLPKSHNSVVYWIKKFYIEQRSVIKGIIGRAKSRITLSTDLWTSGNKLTFCGVVAHFIGKKSTSLYISIQAN